MSNINVDDYINSDSLTNSMNAKNNKVGRRLANRRPSNNMDEEIISALNRILLANELENHYRLANKVNNRLRSRDQLMNMINASKSLSRHNSFGDYCKTPLIEDFAPKPDANDETDIVSHSYERIWDNNDYYKKDIIQDNY